MDPLNNPTLTPTPTPSTPPEPPVPPEGPVPPVPPVPPVSPVPPAPASEPTMPPLEPAPTPPAPIEPPVSTPGPAAVFGSSPTPAPAATPAEGATPANPVFRPEVSGVAATDSILMAEPPKEPDPVEQELNAPMVAAGPAPGSIGSAISGPAEALSELSEEAMPNSDNPFRPSPTPVGPAQNIAFNDPAIAPAQNMEPQAMGGKAPSSFMAKLQDKKMMVILIAVAAVVVIVLIIILIVQLASGSSSTPPASNNGGNSQGVVESESEELNGVVRCNFNEDSIGSTMVMDGASVSFTESFSMKIKNDEVVSVTTYTTTIGEDGNRVTNSATEPFTADSTDFDVIENLPFDEDGTVTVDSLEEFSIALEDSLSDTTQGYVEIVCEVEL